MRRLQYIVFVFSLLLWGVTLRAQELEYGVTLDTNYMLIGDQQQLIFKVRGDGGVRVLFPQLKDTVVSGVEIISGPVRDSVREKDGKWLFEEKYVITAFDTGVYVIPPFPLTIENEEYNNILRTESVAFAVNTFQVDPQKGNYDIVMPKDAPWTFAEILRYLLWGLAVMAFLAAAILLYLRYRKKGDLFVPKKEVIPPHVKAIRALDGIREDKLWQIGKEKEYYTRLTDVVRVYMDEELGVPAMEQTSSETLHSLEECVEVEASERGNLAEMLATADFVKFAKFTPLADENTRHLNTAYDFVRATHERVQAKIDERMREEERQRLAEEERRRSEEEREQKKREQEGHEQDGHEQDGVKAWQEDGVTV